MKKIIIFIGLKILELLALPALYGIGYMCDYCCGGETIAKGQHLLLFFAGVMVIAISIMAVFMLYAIFRYAIPEWIKWNWEKAKKWSRK